MFSQLLPRQLHVAIAALILAFVFALPASAQDDMLPFMDVPLADDVEAAPMPEEEEEEQNQPQPGAASESSRMTQNAIIQYDQESGQVVVIADEETNQYIQQVIEHLDKPIPQVSIKVLFLEVTHTNGLDLGVQAAYKDIDGDRSQSILSNFGLGAETTGGIYQLLDTDVEVLIRAIAETNKLEVLSRPSVMIRNNQLATITVGQTIPYVTSSRVTDSGQTINNIAWRDIGIILRVTPHITPEGMVEMEVSPEISKLTSETVAITDTVGANIIDTRLVDTQVVVENGKTVVIGGMMEDAKIEKITKIPLIGDIPMLGALFRRTQSTSVKTELLIFLTPYIVERSADVRKFSLDEKNRAGMMREAFTSKQLDKYIDNLDGTSDNTPQAAVTVAPAVPVAPSVSVPATPARSANKPAANKGRLRRAKK